MADQILERTETAVIFKTDAWGPAVPYSSVDHQDGTFNHGFSDLRDARSKLTTYPNCNVVPVLRRSLEPLTVKING